MNILVLGADGRIGQLVTEMASERGHNVTALALHPERVQGIKDDVTIIEGDATDMTVVDTAINGQDAVISTLGHNKYTQVEMQSNAMRVITSAMKHHDISRIVSLTGYGVFSDGDSPTILDRFLLAGLMFFDPKRAQDGIKHVEVLKDSQLDWVVLRTPKHRTSKKVTSYTVKPTIKGAKLTVARPSIADYLLVLAESDDIVDRLPVISG